MGRAAAASGERDPFPWTRTARWPSWSWRGPMAATTPSASTAALGRAISSAGDVLTGDTPDELDREIRAHWQAMQ